MDQKLRELQRRLDADPLDPEPVRMLARLHQRQGGLIAGRSLEDWVADLVSEDEERIEAAFAVLTENHPYSALALPAILQRFGRSRRWSAVLTMIENRGRWALPFLMEALGHEQYLVRSRALEGLGALGTRALPALDAMARALDDEHAWVRHKAVAAVGHLGVGAASLEPRLRPLLEAKDPSLAITAAMSLRGIRADFDLDSLVHEMLTRGDAAARRAASQALRRHGVADLSSLVAAQRRRLASDDPRELASVFVVLESLRRGAPELWDLANEARRRLASARRPEDVPALIALLADDHYAVRRAAYENLCALARDDDAALSGLAGAVYGRDDWMRSSAVQALGRLGRRSLEHLKGLQQHPSESIRWWARTLIQRIEREEG